jgi:hypothetical protein
LWSWMSGVRIPSLTPREGLIDQRFCGLDS